MLKNKFSMTKVLVLVLSVLMLVSLAACGNKGEDPVMSSALQDAIDKANQAAADAAKASQAAASASAAAASEAAALSSKQAEVEASMSAALASQSKEIAEQSKDISAALTTTKAPVTTTPTTTKAPVKEDITAVLEEYSTLKTKYTISNKSLYLSGNFEDLCLLFDKAGVDLNNATTVAAAKTILETLKVDAAAIESVKTVANAVKAQIAALGDVETEVFTTAYEKVEAADEAFRNMLVKYKSYFSTTFIDNDDKVAENVDGWSASKIKDVGLKNSVADLQKAIAKIDVLTDYIEDSLRADIISLYSVDGDNFDEDDMTDAKEDVIASAYYKYLVVSVVNGGDLVDADVAIDWEDLVDPDGKKIKYTKDANGVYNYEHPWGAAYTASVDGKTVMNKKAPTEFFTTDEFIEIYATPYLNKALETVKANAIEALEDATIIANITGKLEKADANYIAEADDIQDAIDDIVEAFADEMEELTFVGDYKGNATLGDATIDVWTKYVDAYIAAANSIIELSKETAVEYFDGYIDDKIDELDDEKSSYAANVEKLNAKLAQFTANVQSAPVYTFADLTNVELLDKYDEKYDDKDEDYDIADYITADDGVDANLIDYIENVVAGTIDLYFKSTNVSTGSDQTGMLGDITPIFVADLEALRERLDPANEEDADLYWANKGAAVAYKEDTYARTANFEALVAKIDETIEAINALKEEDYTDTEVQIKNQDNNNLGSDNKKKALYYLNADAKAYVEKEYPEQIDREVFLYNDAKNVNKISNSDKNSNYLTVSKTDYPLTYTYTAAEQACKAAYDAYNALYTEIHNTIQSYNGNITNTQKAINNTNAYKAIKSNVGGSADLLAEVEAYAALYTGYISTDAKLSNAFNTAAWATTVSKSDYIISNDEKVHVTINDDDVDNAANYDEDGILDNIEPWVTKFNDTFYTDGTQTESNLVVLWNYKNAAVQYLTETIASYKNTYTTDKDTGKLEVTLATAANAYAYDDTNVTVKSKAATAYEAQLDSLLASYTEKILAVTLSSRVEVRNGLSKNMDSDATNGKDSDNLLLAKVGDKKWTIDSAKAIVNAYVADMMGYDVAVAAGYGAGVTDRYSSTTLSNGAINADSRVYFAYKSAYLSNFDAIVLPVIAY